ncbi:uncharacterized protein ACLA_016680 [Aspergillus clavatus NRRL 1]|uniref:Apple domain-containing protein n=1 Tax=Aspergillus clavatus (strain ATCC 1007 / CBS 513.65 / DSM 816 / NCTC 3887 / NRRL 1 / QM 1276 / 107) TaxID=344612 RepID=A1CBV4_ASPCL|nr:uncharacterized protein ACLA_016680 [Aspergillus clavatus NRRL 1]EAW13222.1 hypothetical protein ACLA_016680 [Aspergillus clavatus NRRL 1]
MADFQCPGINKTMIAGSTGALFTVLCGVDWPKGDPAMTGNGNVADLGRATVYSLQECINACLKSYENCKAVTYQANLTASFDGEQDGNCWFKDRAGKYFPGADTSVAAVLNLLIKDVSAPTGFKLIGKWGVEFYRLTSKR